MTVQTWPLLDGVLDHQLLLQEVVQVLTDKMRRPTDPTHPTTLGSGPWQMLERKAGWSTPILDHPSIMKTNHDTTGIPNQDVTMLSRHAGDSPTWNQEPVVTQNQNAPTEHKTGITIQGAATTKTTIGVYWTMSRERITQSWNFLVDRTGPSEDAVMKLSRATILVTPGMKEDLRGRQCTNPVSATTMTRAVEVKDPTLGETSPLSEKRGRSLIMVAVTILAWESLATMVHTTAPDTKVAQAAAPIGAVADSPTTIQVYVPIVDPTTIQV
jgi:hypothetical protein